MKHAIPSLLLIAMFLFVCMGGCSSAGSLKDDGMIQTVLNEVLPPDFEGDLDAKHDGFYFGTHISLTIDLRGLKKNADGKWKWSAGGYVRDGFFSQGHVTLKPKNAH